MNNKNVSKKLLAIFMAAAMSLSFSSVGFAEDRVDADTIKADNLPSGDAESSAEVNVESEGKKTEYPLTITTYDYEGNEVETTYEKAPEKVLAVYQGSIETMLALGLEDRLCLLYTSPSPRH